MKVQGSSSTLNLNIPGCNFLFSLEISNFVQCMRPESVTVSFVRETIEQKLLCKKSIDYIL